MTRDPGALFDAIIAKAKRLQGLAQSMCQPNLRVTPRLPAGTASSTMSTGVPGVLRFRVAATKQDDR
jgi:hypothetical protein